MEEARAHLGRARGVRSRREPEDGLVAAATAAKAIRPLPTSRTVHISDKFSPILKCTIFKLGDQFQNMVNVISHPKVCTPTIPQRLQNIKVQNRPEPAGISLWPMNRPVLYHYHPFLLSPVYHRQAKQSLAPVRQFSQDVLA